MRRIFSLLAGIAVALTLSTSAFAKDQTVTMKVKGWHCGGCSESTAAKIKEVKGVKEVATNTEAKTATVTFDDPATVALLEKAIADSGYSVER